MVDLPSSAAGSGKEFLKAQAGTGHMKAATIALIPVIALVLPASRHDPVNDFSLHVTVLSDID